MTSLRENIQIKNNYAVSINLKNLYGW